MSRIVSFIIRICSASISPILEAEPPVKHSGEDPRHEGLLRDTFGCAVFNFWLLKMYDVDAHVKSPQKAFLQN